MSETIWTYVRFADQETGEYKRMVRIDCQARSVYDRLVEDAEAMGCDAKWGEEADWTNGLAFKLYPCCEMTRDGYTEIAPPTP